MEVVAGAAEKGCGPSQVEHQHVAGSELRRLTPDDGNALPSRHQVDLVHLVVPVGLVHTAISLVSTPYCLESSKDPARHGSRHDPRRRPRLDHHLDYGYRVGEGSAEKAPKDDRELSMSVELSSGELLDRVGLPGAELAASYKRTWDRQGSRFLTRALQYAGTDEAGIAARIDRDHRFGSVLAAAGQQATVVGDELMQDWLARLVAAAFADDAKVDTVAFLVNMIAQLEPVHLRALRETSKPLRRSEALERVGVEMPVYRAALLRLESLGLVEESHPSPPPEPRWSGRPSWTRTPLGDQLLNLCEQAQPPTPQD
jgi:hypothetical protein